jgi:small-conductance mechanosensitive channel
MDYTQWPAIVGDLFARLAQTVTSYFPNIVGALALLVIGWGVARLLRFGAARLVLQLNRLIPSHVLGREIKASGIDKMSSNVVSKVVFWAVFLFFVAAATEVLNLTVVTGSLGQLAAYLPTVLAAVLVVLGGLVTGNIAQSIVSKTAASAEIEYAEALGQTAKAGILLLAGLVALDQVGIDSTLLILVTSIIIGVVLGGLALAFGLGARTVVGNILASHYLHQAYQVGHRIRVGEIRGRIDEIRPTHVILEADEGRVLVPAKEFAEKISVLLHEGSEK